MSLGGSLAARTGAARRAAVAVMAVIRVNDFIMIKWKGYVDVSICRGRKGNSCMGILMVVFVWYGWEIELGI